jgi:hypothetical protein
MIEHIFVLILLEATVFSKGRTNFPRSGYFSYVEKFVPKNGFAVFPGDCNRKVGLRQVLSKLFLR